MQEINLSDVFEVYVEFSTLHGGEGGRGTLNPPCTVYFHRASLAREEMLKPSASFGLVRGPQLRALFTKEEAVAIEIIVQGTCGFTKDKKEAIRLIEEGGQVREFNSCCGKVKFIVDDKTKERIGSKEFKEFKTLEADLDTLRASIEVQKNILNDLTMALEKNRTQWEGWSNYEPYFHECSEG